MLYFIIKLLSLIALTIAAEHSSSMKSSGIRWLNSSVSLADKDQKFMPIANDTCRYVMNLPFEERCDFVYKTEDCSFQEPHIFKPESWVFCASSNTNSIFGIIGMVLSFSLLLLMITVVADAFVCPNVAVIANILRLSENIAGITILALGNGAPDLFTALAAEQLDHPEILFAGATGSALFVTTLASGIVIYCRPFHINAWGFMLNSCFLFVSYAILFYGFATRTYKLAHAIAIMVVYFIYILVNVVEAYVGQKFETHRETLVVKDAGELKDLYGDTVYLPPELRYRASVGVEVFKQLERQRIYKQLGAVPAQKRYFRGSSLFEVRTLFSEFKECIIPITREDWEGANMFDKFLLILQGSITFLMNFILPVVNTDKPNDGWCKLSYMIKMLIFPTFLVFAADQIDSTIGDSPIWAYTIALGVLSSLIIFVTTKPYIRPKGFEIFAFLGFLGSVLMVEIFADNVIIHLQTIGARFNVSTPLLALTLLAIGNSIGDLVISYGLAKQGMQNMGMAACFGGPMFNISFSIPLCHIIGKLHGHRIAIFYGQLSPGAGLYLLISLLASLVYLPLMDFHGRSSYGIFLIILYITYLIVTFLMESTIHPFGTQAIRHKRI